MLIATDEYMVAKQSAIELFENGKYKEAFYIFAGLYNQIEDSEERNWIHSILMDAYYLPNKDEQKNLYQKNVKLLESYPYFYGNLKGENQYLFCLTSEEEVGIYDAIKKEWIEYATVQTEHCTKNLFAQLEVDENSVGGGTKTNPLFYENEVNIRHLVYLNDIVRKSEYCGMDNHIYLYYDRIHFELLLHCIDLEQIIQDNKFIFLIDESMKGNYPLDFKSEYGIDYEEMGVKEFHANELQRILFNRTYLYAGNHFLHDILNGSEQIVDIMNAVFYAESSKRMIRLYFHYTSNAEKIINIPEFILFLEKYKDEIAWECKNEVQNELVRLLIENEKGNLPFWKLWKWIIVAMIAVSHRFENKQYYNRVIPTVFWDAHLLEAQESHYSVLKSFKYPNIIGLVRDPIVALVRQVENLGPGTEYEFETLLMNCCTRAKDIPEYFMKCGYYIMRFEDLKRNPIPVLKKFCEKIQIPYSKGLLNGRAGIYYGSPVVNEKGEKIQGFDQRTVMRDMSESIPPFDQARLDIAYGRIKEILGYGTAVKWNYNKEELEIMFSIPFQFEKKHEETRKIIFEYLDKIENKLLRKAIERERGLSPERFRSILQKKLLELCVNEELYCYPIPKIIEK